jgi:DnaJ family protein C protein 9
VERSLALRLLLKRSPMSLPPASNICALRLISITVFDALLLRPTTLLSNHSFVYHSHTIIMSNATIVAAAFGEGADLYEILGVTDTATAAQLRKAYYRKSLKCHPDKVAGKQDEFQALTVAYNVLKDDNSRKEYDDSGELVDADDGENANSFDDMKNYFSSIFGQVTVSKIDQFAEKYKCSEEEESDVLKYYQQCKGHVGKMLQNVMLSTERDAERWIEDYLKPAIESGGVPDYTKNLNKTLQACLKKLQQEEEIDDDEEAMEAVFDDDATESDDSDEEPQKKPPAKNKVSPKKVPPAKKRTTPAKQKKKTKAQREAEEAEAFMAFIQGRKKQSSLTIGQQGYNTVLNGLASKYGGVVEDDDPLDDEAFAKIQAGMAKKKKSKRK